MANGEIHVQLAVNYGEDPQIRALARFGRDARACRDLYVQMLCHCKRNLTDGFVLAEEIGVLVYPDSPKTGKRDAGRLVEVGLVAVVEGGYMVAGFLKRNKSKAQVEEISAAKAESGRRGGKRSGQVRRGEAKPKQSASQDGNQVASPDEANAKHSASVCLNTEVIGHRSEVIGQTDADGASAAAADKPRRDLTITQRSKRITDAYAEAEPMCKWPAVNGVVIKALKSERFSDLEITAALLRMAEENRSVTVDSLRTELGGMPPLNGRASPAVSAGAQKGQQAVDAGHAVQAMIDEGRYQQ